MINVNILKITDKGIKYIVYIIGEKYIVLTILHIFLPNF